MQTWLDVKIATLQKMNAITGDILVENTSTTPYLKAMPQAANEALQLLSTAGKYIIKSVGITQNPITNILPNPLYMMNIYSHTNEVVEYSAIGAKAYYFEADNTATIEISVDNVVVQTILNTVKGKFTAHKGIVSNPNGKTVKIAFKGLYSYSYRNIALYNVNFETEADIWEYVSEKRYNLKSLATDFYKLKDIIYQSGFNEVRYENTENFHFEGDSVLVLGGFNKGSWLVTYFAYPQQITKTTLDTAELSLDPEVVVLLPLYMASQLYKDDDVSLAVGWRNEFEVARELLRPNTDRGTIEFINESGW